jgi:serine/threonine protein kinase
MSLTLGTRIGAYEVISMLGAGGMGEAYRARDTKLNRDVALKVVGNRVAVDSQRLARFKREARILATLNHSNIGAVYGLEETDDDRQVLVLELVEAEPWSIGLPVGRSRSTRRCRSLCKLPKRSKTRTNTASSIVI